MDTLLRQTEAQTLIVLWDGTNRTQWGKQLTTPSEPNTPAPVLTPAPSVRESSERAERPRA